ncbi:MAG: universal stress protein [Endozoicomonas sp. (ex Botrylloides leachii)]|nr:universal stress protein [Endozoicomonas sp. (ex Botrylloides leachii)]
MHAFRNILLVISRSDTADIEFHQIFKLAADNRAHLHVALFDNSLDVMQKLQFLPMEKQIESMLLEQLEKELNRIKTLAWNEGLLVDTQIIPGRPRDSVLKMVNERNCDLVIKLADPSGVFSRKQLAGNDLALLRKCPVPVLIIADRGQLPSFSGKIMVAIDAGNPEKKVQELNQHLLQYGLYIATQEQAELHCVSVWDLPAGGKRALRMLSDEELYELQEITRKRYRCKQAELVEAFNINQDGHNRVHMHLLKGLPSHEIQRLANELEIDLIIMGTRGIHSQNVVIGNTAENILNGVYCSVLAVHPEDCSSPVK